MDCKTHNQDTAGPLLLALIDRQGGDLGATLLRLAHRAAAAHRFEQAAGATRSASPHLAHADTVVDAKAQRSGGGGTS